MDKKNKILKSIESIRSIIAAKRSPDDSLLSGNLGLVIYHNCIANIFNDKKSLSTSLEIFEEIFDKIKASDSSLKTYQYSNGLSGLGVVTQFLIDEDVIDFDIDQDLELIDEFIYEKALEQISKGYVEFLHGGCGTLYYLNTRKPSSIVTKYKEHLVRAILEQIELDPLKFRIPRSHFIWTKNDDYDLSLSHGLCGVMLVLLSVLEKGDVENTHLICDFLERATNFMLNLKREVNREKGSLSFFPSYLPKRAPLEEINEINFWENSRLAWCYGDLGWVLFFYRYGKFINNPSLIDLADEVGIFTAGRKRLDQTDSSSTHICHGHAGLALFYQKLYRIRHKKEYKVACEYWLQQTLEKLEREIEDGTFTKRSAEASFLEGLAGVNLVLASFHTPGNDKWAHFLLL